MAVNVADYLVTDDLTILLGLIGATLFLLNNLYKPQPLVHPILLGRQSEAARVRYPGESAVYRNYSTGLLGRFPIRPSKEVHLLPDCVKQDVDMPRTLWSTKINNVTLQDRVAAFGTGLLRLAGLKPRESDVLLLLNDGIEFVISDLALATHSIVSYTLHSSDLLSQVLESRHPSAIITHAHLLPQLLELIYDAETRIPHTIIVVGEPSSSAMASVASQIKILKFSELEREGNRVEKILSPVPKPSDVFTVHLFRKSDGPIVGAQFTHENFTAGVAATRLILPASQPLTPLDTVVSAHPVSSPYGRSILYAAIFEGTSFASTKSAKLFAEDDGTHKYVDDLQSFKEYPIPSPTIFFLQSNHLVALTKAIKDAADSSFISSIAWRHKLAALKEGFITKESLWDRLVFDVARTKVIGDCVGTLRAVIVSGSMFSTHSLIDYIY
ncbi:hypothetical protein AX16_008161 [Volvariella volvacea WC 439]|nr:hypothetical protein AX16_008161 [Volvariella volvacea WC 439]